jgi:hypothetical protein
MCLFASRNAHSNRNDVASHDITFLKYIYIFSKKIQSVFHVANMPIHIMTYDILFSNLLS